MWLGPALRRAGREKALHAFQIRAAGLPRPLSVVDDPVGPRAVQAAAAKPSASFSAPSTRRS